MQHFNGRLLSNQEGDLTAKSFLDETDALTQKFLDSKVLNLPGYVSFLLALNSKISPKVDIALHVSPKGSVSVSHVLQRFALIHRV